MAHPNNGGPPNDGAPHPADEFHSAPSASTAVALSPSAGVVASAGETASSALAAREKASVEARFLMAIGMPRHPENARIRLVARCKNARFAEVAEYAKPLGGGKSARGASIRMMEEIARQWGNIDVQSIVIFDDAERRTIRVTATDLETNYTQSTDVMVEKTVERKAPRAGDAVISSRMNSSNQRVYRIEADEDAFLVKQNANVAKARREMIRAVVPGDLVDEAREECAKTRAGEATADPSVVRKKITDAFYSFSVLPSDVAEYLGKSTLDVITPAEIEHLRTILTALRDGETTWLDVVAERKAATGASTTSATASGGQEKGATAKLRDLTKKTAEKTVQTEKVDKVDKAPCGICGRSDGTHDPEKACYAD